MFISNKDKQYINQALNDLNRKVDAQADIHRQSIAALNKENKRLSDRLNILVSGNIAKVAREDNQPLKVPTEAEIEAIKQRVAHKREYARQYYWRKKAERIKNGSEETIRVFKSKRKFHAGENTNNTSV